MERFSLSKYLKNPSRRVVTRDGRNVRIICTDMKNTSYPIVALITDKEVGEFCIEYTPDGKFRDLNTDYTFNLFFTPEKHEGWINIYRSEYEDYYQGKIIYSSKEDAIKRGKKTPYYITTTKIEWEE